MLECDQTLFLLLSERCRIHTLPLIYLLVQLPSALGSLPAPVNLNVKSLNLHHVLHWEPGPGSPTGTKFWIFKGVFGENLRQVRRPTTSTSSKLKLQIMNKYELAVQASYNNTRSLLSDKITFEPLYSTIGPPLLSLAGCGSCIQINISLPDEIQRQYGSSFSVQWRKGKDGEIQELEKREKSFYLKNLEKDVEYCVQVDIKIRVNKNTLPSGWNCTFTSIPEPKTGMLVLVIVTALLILLLIVLTMGIFCLYYTGFLCKLKEMPTALMFVLWPDYVLTPNNMVLNQVTIISQPVKSRNCPTMSHPSNGASNSEDEDGEEEDAANLYMDRNAELSSGRGSHQDSANTSVNLGEDVRMDSGSFTEKQPAVLEEQQVESGHCEAEAVQVSFMHDGNQSGPQVRVMVQEEEMKTGTQDVYGDVNLFSVTFASMATCDEGEIEEEDDSENSSTDFLRIYTLKPLSQMDSQCEQDDPVSAPLMHPSEENFIESGYDGKRADSWMDYEEEEELSGYLTHK